MFNFCGGEDLEDCRFNLVFVVYVYIEFYLWIVDNLFALCAGFTAFSCGKIIV